MPRARTIAPDAALGRPVDLRRTVGRELAEHLIDRAAALPPKDRALVEAVYRDGMSVARLASLTSPPGGERERRALRRRVRRLTERLSSPQFAFVVRRRDRWPATRRRIATEWAVEGRSLRSIADRMGISAHVVRGHVLAIQALVDESRRAEAA